MKKQKLVKKLLKKNGLTNFNYYRPIIGYNSGSSCIVMYTDLSSNTIYQASLNPTGSTQVYINATPSAITWTSGGTLTQQISVIDNYGTNVISNCVFKSSDDTIASVNSTGLITEVATGVSTITVTYINPTTKLKLIDTILVQIA